MQAAGRRAVDLGHGNVDALGVRGDAPLDPAEPAAAARAVPPDLLALLVGIERVDDARFLPRDDELVAAGQLSRARGDAPKSKSGPARSPQFTSPGVQPNTSGVDGAICRAQRIAPVLRSNASTASVVGCAGPL